MLLTASLSAQHAVMLPARACVHARLSALQCRLHSTTCSAQPGNPARALGAKLQRMCLPAFLVLTKQGVPGAAPAIPAEHTSCFTCCYLRSNTSQPGAEGFVVPGCGGRGTCNKCRNLDAARSSSFGARNAQVLWTVTNQSHHAEPLSTCNQAFSVQAGCYGCERSVSGHQSSN
jgi:hypothetical protein